jgi:putative ABC transport system substrate-binding protein
VRPTFRTLALLLLALVAMPFTAGAQGKVYRIGVLDTTPAATNAANLDAFRRGLRELGYVEGRNLVIEYRSMTQTSQIPELAQELVRAKVDVIVTRGTAATRATQNASRTIPIVMAASGDPVGTGVVSGLANPGGNVTGLTSLTAEVSVKRLEMLKETIPGLKRVAVMIDLGMGLITLWKTTEETARGMGMTAHLLDVRKAEDIGPAFEAAVKQRAGALVTGVGPVLQNNASRIVELAAKHRLPAMFPSREFADAGGLMAYGVSFPDSYRRAATYVDKILKGAKPADLPIEQPTKFELVINLKTAKRLGLTIPHAVLVRADEVIR